MAIPTVIFMEENYHGKLLFPDGGNEFYDGSEYEVIR